MGLTVFRSLGSFQLELNLFFPHVGVYQCVRGLSSNLVAGQSPNEINCHWSDGYRSKRGHPCNSTVQIPHTQVVSIF